MAKWTYVIEHPTRGQIDLEMSDRDVATLLVQRKVAADSVVALSLMKIASETDGKIKVPHQPNQPGGVLRPPKT